MGKLSKFLYSLGVLFLTPTLAFGQCPAVKSGVRYQVGEGEYPAFIVRKFKLEPLWCDRCAVQNFLLINDFKIDVKLQPGSWVQIPESCQKVNTTSPEIPVPPDLTESKIEAKPAPAYFRSPLSGNGIRISSKDTGLLVQNGSNDWDKMSCQGERTLRGCIEHHGFQELRLDNKLRSLYVVLAGTGDSSYISSLGEPGLAYSGKFFISNSWALNLDLGASYLSFDDSASLDYLEKKIYGRGVVGISFDFDDWAVQLGAGREEFPVFVPSGNNRLQLLPTDIKLVSARLDLGSSRKNFWRSSFIYETSLPAYSNGLNFRPLMRGSWKNNLRWDENSPWSLGLDLAYEKIESTQVQKQSQISAAVGVSFRWDR